MRITEINAQPQSILAKRQDTEFGLSKGVTLCLNQLRFFHQKNNRFVKEIVTLSLCSNLERLISSFFFSMRWYRNVIPNEQRDLKEEKGRILEQRFLQLLEL